MTLRCTTILITGTSSKTTTMSGPTRLKLPHFGCAETSSRLLLLSAHRPPIRCRVPSTTHTSPLPAPRRIKQSIIITRLVLRRRAHLMDQFDGVFHGLVEHLPFALLETVFGVSLRTVHEHRPGPATANQNNINSNNNAHDVHKYIRM